MSSQVNLAIIGSGPSAIYLLKHILDEGGLLKECLSGISIFEKSQLTGMGMPYSPLTTDRFNLANISSEELPELPVSLVDWLHTLDPADLQALGMEDEEISADKIYPRLVLGQYLHSQYQILLSRLGELGIKVREYPGCEVRDLQDDPPGGKVTLVTAHGESHDFEKVIIATGHHWTEQDRPETGYYASPWPITKLIPEEGCHYNFAIGTLGASLSAFDVISSLAHRQGRFIREAGKLRFEPAPETEEFKIVMHAMHGWLPHLQFDQEEPLRDIYRHVSREELLGLINEAGFLRLEEYFDKVCRPALIKAFTKDGMTEMVRKLEDREFALADFVETMNDKHDYSNAFEGMRHEMVEARKSVLGHKPIHWKEVIDDLMYTLNFHAGLMPAEDHLVLRSLVMPFLMSVIAAMPLESGEILLALYDAGKVGIVSGKASVAEEADEEGATTLSIEDEEGRETRVSYRIFVECGGQKPLDLSDYPFPNLVDRGVARKARASFADPSSGPEQAEDKKEHLFHEDGEALYHLGGVDVDGSYRLVGSEGQGNPRLCDVAFPHISGVRPYSYGLQCCSDTAAIMIQAWVQELGGEGSPSDDPQEVTRIYEEI
ncbi:FAD/NAD(P)-binding protein [Luteolibacter arcticus]|uniref:FAD/NAD(P)-binding protein n=1 Tax=Luteolibacter arcticus TaxID=1581411 RepID=A0ABT3GH21_9BACT|nr:FAD/NAD(P)-binding protein [Luteolibacter arcticus]MCW1922913.1 FAD/NAD(P)-binding protein [Luteolibacter arcticus]